MTSRYIVNNLQCAELNHGGKETKHRSCWRACEVCMQPCIHKACYIANSWCNQGLSSPFWHTSPCVQNRQRLLGTCEWQMFLLKKGHHYYSKPIAKAHSPWQLKYTTHYHPHSWLDHPPWDKKNKTKQGGYTVFSIRVKTNIYIFHGLVLIVSWSKSSLVSLFQRGV